ncbi:GNAT family N-acetyltransferase [Aquihabitans daechungensis]|uniref:GNAT family N-acetyltransferase n=1 Tax=Aquihabitans daechungensis TaxID=1052257 RepID=UPI003B9EC477
MGPVRAGDPESRPGELAIRSISAEETYPLRREVLRDGRSAPPVYASGDSHIDAIHLLAIVDGVSAGVVSTYPAAIDPRFIDPSQSSWVLVGMAVREHFRGCGVGGCLMDRLVESVEVRGGTTLWARVRDVAIPFYRRHLFVVSGDGYEHVGLPHHTAARTLAVPAGGP